MVTDVYALIEVGFGPLPAGTTWEAVPVLSDLETQICDLIFDQGLIDALPGGADPDMSCMMRTLDEVGLSEHGDRRTVEEVYARLGHYVSTYCIHDDCGDCRYFCKTCRKPCQCHCHEGQLPPMCSTMGHEDIPAVGACTVDAEDDRPYPYCQECLDSLDPDNDRRAQRIAAVARHLLANARQLRELHHARLRLDANGAHLLAELAVDALDRPR